MVAGDQVMGPGGGDRDAGGLGEGQQFAVGIGEANAGASQDEGPVSGLQAGEEPGALVRQVR